MSSAILYAAIIAIWACVLIPRWLKRDTSQAKTAKAARERAEAEAGAGEAVVQMAEDAGQDEDDRYDEEPGVPMAYAPDPEARRRVLAARRRMLLMLLALAMIAVGVVVVGLAAWWVALPPALMLAGYVLLLREARRADADRARALADAAAYRKEEARRRATERETAERRRAALEQSRTALVIDISERVRDELYDQYADAERRAVGD